MSETEAIDRLRRGDIGGLEILVRRYQVQAVRAAYLIVRDRELAQDIVGDVFVRSYERIRQFKADRPFGPWFIRSVVNEALKAVERRNRHVSFDSQSAVDGPIVVDLLVDPGPGPDALAELREMRRALEDALKSLTPRQRAVIVLRYYVGLSQAEVAEELSSPLGTVKRRLHDARIRLRTLLDDLVSGRAACREIDERERARGKEGGVAR